MAAITLRGVSKSYSDNGPTVLRNVDLDIDTHEFCVFLGPSGCGKSTLLRIIAGLEDPSDGDVNISGKRVNEVAPAQRGVAMVFQSYALFPHMTVRENIGFGLKLAKTPAEEIEWRVNEAATILQLEPYLDRKPKALSGGQRQRVAIGRAIVREPGVFLFDEPLSNLDAALRGKTRLEIAKIHARFDQSSTVYVTHDQIEAMTLADKIVLLNAGKNAEQFGSVAQVGSPLELYHRPKSMFVAGFIGAPQMNFLDSTVTQITSKGVTVTINETNETVHANISSQQLSVGESVTLGIRPEHILVNVNKSDEYHSILHRKITLIERLGEQTYLHLATSTDNSMMVKVHGNSLLNPKDDIQLSVPAEYCHIFTADGLAVPHLQ